MNNQLEIERIKSISKIFDKCKRKKDIFDVLEAQQEVKKERYDTTRWWVEMKIVVKTPDNKFIRYIDAVSTGDESPQELGYDGARLDDVVEVFPKEVKVITYVDVDGK